MRARIRGAGDPVKGYRIDADQVAREFICLPFFWIPRGNIKALEQIDRCPIVSGPIAAWSNRPTATFDIIDYAYIRARLIALKEQYSIEEIGLDPWNADAIRNRYGAELRL